MLICPYGMQRRAHLSWTVFTMYCVCLFYSIQSRLKPGVTQGMLVHFNCIFFFIYVFALGYSSYPGLEIDGWLCFGIWFWFWILIDLNLAVRCIFLRYSSGSWAYINIWVPLQVEMCSLMCILYAVLMICWLIFFFLFFFCFCFFGAKTQSQPEAATTIRVQ